MPQCGTWTDLWKFTSNISNIIRGEVLWIQYLNFLNNCSYFKISVLSHRMKTNTEMVFLRNFKRCRPPDWSIVKLLESFFYCCKYKYLKYVILVNVGLCSLLNKYSFSVKYHCHCPSCLSLSSPATSVAYLN